jgi:hypothetical protein
MKRSFSRKTKLFRKKGGGSTKKHKGGMFGSLYGGVLDIKDETLKTAFNTIPIFKMSVANFLSTAVSKILGYGSNFTTLGVPFVMFASWSDRRARQKILDKLNNARNDSNKAKYPIKFPHIWKNVSVNNKIIKSNNIFYNNVGEFTTRGYAYESHHDYKNWYNTEAQTQSQSQSQPHPQPQPQPQPQRVCSETRDQWLTKNPLEGLSFLPDELNKPIVMKPEDKQQIEEDVKRAMIEVEQKNSSESGSGGGKHKSRRVTKHKRK